MKLSGLKNLLSPPPLFAEFDNIPWHEPAFSERMLGEHLDQSHNLASRRMDIIDVQVGYIHDALIQARLGLVSADILDLGCGPGLYANRLAQLGHRITAIDFSPASIHHAKAHKVKGARFIHGDFRTTDYAGPHDVALMLYGEFNVFREVDIKTILTNVARSLNPGGLFVAEINNRASLEARCAGKPSFTFVEHGLFHSGPHLLLEEAHWFEAEAALATRITVIDALTNDVRQYGASYRSYTDIELDALMSGVGFEDIAMQPDLGVDAGFNGFVLTARKAD